MRMLEIRCNHKILKCNFGDRDLLKMINDYDSSALYKMYRQATALFDPQSKVLNEFLKAYTDVMNNGGNADLKLQPQYSISNDLEQRLDYVLKNGYKENDDILIGTTSDFLINKLHMPKSISKFDVYMNSKKAYIDMVSKKQMIEDGHEGIGDPHNLGSKGLYDVLVASEDPVAAFVTFNKNTGLPSRNRITIVTNINKGKLINIVGMEFSTDANTIKDGSITVNKDITAFAKNNVANLIKNAIDDGTLLYFNNEKNQSISEDARIPFPMADTKIDYETNIKHFWNNFKPQSEINREAKANSKFSISDNLDNLLRSNTTYQNALGLLDGYAGISTDKGSFQTDTPTKEKVLNQNIKNFYDSIEDQLNSYLEQDGLTILIQFWKSDTVDFFQQATDQNN